MLGHYHRDSYNRITGLSIWSGHLLRAMMRVLLRELYRQRVLASPPCFVVASHRGFQSWPRCRDKSLPQKGLTLHALFPQVETDSLTATLGNLPTVWVPFFGGGTSPAVKHTEMLREKCRKHSEMENCSQKWQSLCVHWQWSSISLNIVIFLLDFSFPLNWSKQKMKWLYSFRN